MNSITRHLTLRILLPATLLTLMVAFTSISYLGDRRAWHNVAETNSTQLIRREVARLAMLAEGLLVEDSDMLDDLVAELGQLVDLRLALIIDDQGRVLHSNQVSLIGNTVQQISKAAQNIYLAASQQKLFKLQSTGTTLAGAISFSIPSSSHKDPPYTRGVVYVEFDRIQLFERSHKPSPDNAIFSVLAGLPLILLIYLFFYHYLAKPLDRLGPATRHVQLGKNTVVDNSNTPPEVAILTANFNNITRQLSDNITLLSKSEAAARQLNQHQQALLSALPDPVLELDEDGYYLNIHSHSESTLSILNKSFIGKHLSDALPPAAVKTVMSTIQTTLKIGFCTGKTIKCEDPHNDNPTWFELSAARKPAQKHLHNDTVLIILRNITSHQQTLQHEKSRNHVLNLLARGESQEQILQLIIEKIEAFAPKMLGSILLLDPSGRHLGKAIAPSLPKFYSEAINGLEIGYAVGSCGTAAATDKRVIVEDISNHPSGKPFKALAARANLNSCWSEPIRSSSGNILGTLAIYHRKACYPDTKQLRYITELGRLAGLIIERTRLQEEMELASLVFQHTSEAMMVTDSDNKILTINPAFTTTTGYEEEDALGQTPNMLSSGRQDGEFYTGMWEQLQRDGIWRGEIWNRRKNGEEYAEWLTINTIYDKYHEVHRRVALFSDITDKKEAEALIWNQANYDHLTQLPNRRLFNDRLKQELSKALRQQQRVGLLFIDLDHFKEVNDSLGHQVGDLLLIEAAHRIRRIVRDSDTVARLGGDEFTVLLPDLTETDSMERIAISINQTLSEPFQLADDEAHISASIGITAYPDDAQNSEELLKCADKAMYTAKEKGRNRFCYFTNPL